MSIEFHLPTGRYRDSATKKFVGRAKVLELMEAESTRLSSRLKGVARLLLGDKISVAEFQQRSAEQIKASVIRNSILAKGGTSRMTKQDYGRIGAFLKKQYKYLSNFGDDIVAGNMSQKQILNRAGLYSGTARVAFNAGELNSRKATGFLYGRRLLDPQSNHCDSCIDHEQPDWVPIDEITPPGTDCECGSRCRCRVEYRKQAA